jgi:hypothetical protein
MFTFKFWIFELQYCVVWILLGCRCLACAGAVLPLPLPLPLPNACRRLPRRNPEYLTKTKL